MPDPDAEANRDNGPTGITPEADRLRAALGGRYRALRELGSGGMSTVYIAEDLRHDRRVALKVLRPELAEVLGVERFLSEIKTTAGLQHPHIVPLFDSGEAGGLLYYVMPHVQGETLGARLDRERQLPVDEAVRITASLAEALDYAHRQGIIHRDIKPSNVLLHDGEPMIADFGIAMALDVAGRDRLTATGLTLGTPSYMSPEQATGDQPVGAASDIHGLGCLLYEMLVGAPPYTGSTSQAILGQIVGHVPESVNLRRKSVPPHVAAVAAKALEKVPGDRFRSGKELAAALRNTSFRYGDTGAAPEAVRRWRRATASLAVLSAVATFLAIWQLVHPDARPVSRFTLPLTDGQGLAQELGSNVAISPDGSSIVYVGAGADGSTQLWVRSRDELRARALPGTEGAMSPVFAPDGRRVSYMTQNPAALNVTSLDGGQPVVLADSGLQVAGHAWGVDGYIYVDVPAPTGLGRVPETGDEVEPFTTLDPGRLETSHNWPEALPDGKGVIFTIFRDPVRDMGRYDIAVADAETGSHRVLLDGVFARYAASGHLVYVTVDGAMMAAPFDLDRLELSGPPVTLTQGIAVGDLGSVSLALSQEGTLLYDAAGGTVSRLMLVERSGAAELWDPTWGGDFRSPAVSPDGRRLAVELGAPGATHIWVKQTDAATPIRLTVEGGLNSAPAWTADGRSVTFISDRDGHGAVWTKPSDGGAQPVLQLREERAIVEALWSPNGDWLIYRTTQAQSGSGDILAIGPGDTIPRALIATTAQEYAPSLSPDGRWLAYSSNENGRHEIYVVPFPNVEAARWAVSSQGGTEPRWARDGGELFYRGGSGNLVAVQIRSDSTFSWRTQDTLFHAGDYLGFAGHAQYDVTDGRFLLVRPDRRETRELIVVQGFFEELRKLAPR